MTTENITWLQDKLSQARAILANGIEKENSYAASIELDSMRAHISELEHQLLIAQSERQREIFELRLVGLPTTRGSIPLNMLANIATPFHQFLSGAAYWLRHAEVQPKGSSDDWDRYLDIRLVDVGLGSTRLILSANVAPDLAGDSVMQDALISTFNLLNAGPEHIFENLENIGPRAATGLVELLNELEKDGTSAELKWHSPSNDLYVWEGRLDKIVQLRSILENVEQQTETIETLEGVVTLLAATGRIEVLPVGETHSIKVRYPKSKPELVTDLTLLQKVLLKVVVSVRYDHIRNIDIKSYRLVERLDE